MKWHHFLLLPALAITALLVLLWAESRHPRPVAVVAKDHSIEVDYGAKGKKVVRFKLFWFGDGISSVGAKERILKTGYAPADAREMTAFADYYQNKVQKAFNLVALGSEFDDAAGVVAVVVLCADDDGNSQFSFENIDRTWTNQYLFLAVRQ